MIHLSEVGINSKAPYQVKVIGETVNLEILLLLL